MIRSLDSAIAELVGTIPSLRAAVLSAAPDGLIAWCWSREDEPEIALGFARLDRAATACLEALGASRASRSLMLTAKDAWVVARPLEEADWSARARLILTVVFAGELQTGMVIIYAQRVLVRVRAALAEARESGCDAQREQLVELICNVDEPGAAIERLAASAAIDLHRLERIEALGDEERQRLGVEAERHMRAHAASV